MRYRRQPIETVFLPGDEELYKDYIKKERWGRTVPHDHHTYNRAKKRFSYEDKEIKKRIKEALIELGMEDLIDELED